MMAVAEGIDDAGIASGMPDHRQRIRHRGAKAHPAPGGLPGVEMRKEALEPCDHGGGPLMIGRGVDTAEFDGAADPVSGRER